MEDPWAGILPKKTPRVSERLTTDVAKQRHTILFTPRLSKNRRLYNLSGIYFLQINP